MKSSEPILDHYRCLQQIPGFTLAGCLKEPNGYFRFGQNVICFGQTTGHTRSAVNGDLFEASQYLQDNGRTIGLPFDHSQILDNLRYERYVSPSGSHKWVEASWTKSFYYCLRPLLPVSVRKHLQKAYLQKRENTAFPCWPVDCSADTLLERLLALAMRSLQKDRLPFIWFWPDGHKSAAVMTHDVETMAGRDFCSDLMDLNDSFGIKSSFQIVPEKRYVVPEAYRQNIRDRGFEVNVHGLDHHGNLFESRERFVNDSQKINKYAELYGSRGFRSPSLYRNTDWFHELNFSYDMSVPNVARLEAQRGGCCTIFPYFLPGGMLELPLTTVEDYSLFHILKDYSTTLWKQQMSVILEGHGLMNFLVHPDYVISEGARDVYKALLEEICRVRSSRGVWVALPGEVDRWWRDRNQMKLVPDGHNWRVEGHGSDRAKVAYACLDGDRLMYEIGSPN